jgi:hypothetical protein
MLSMSFDRSGHYLYFQALQIGFLVLLAASLLSPAHAEEKPKDKKSEVKWTQLFDGKNIKDWERTNFGGEGEVKLEEGNMVMAMGSPLTGVHYKGKHKIPRMNYELTLEALKADGDDFFCGLTFPVNDSYVSFICGGWAGGVVGISSIDGMDASENETTEFKNFKKNQWYKIRVRVTENRIQAWIDKDSMVDVDVEDRKLDVRPEVDLSKPLGICAFQTISKLRKIQIRKLDAKELKK